MDGAEFVHWTLLDNRYLHMEPEALVAGAFEGSGESSFAFYSNVRATVDRQRPILRG